MAQSPAAAESDADEASAPASDSDQQQQQQQAEARRACICGNVRPTVLFVDNLVPTTTKDALLSIFTTYDNVNGICMAESRTQEPYASAYVDFKDANSARQAYEGTKDTQVDGHSIRIELAQPQPPSDSSLSSIHHDPATTPPTKYTIYVRDEEFTLRKSQIDFDAPNFFTAYFFGGFNEGATGRTTLHVDRNPELFAVLVEYMSGYSIDAILPFTPPSSSAATSARVFPRTMDTRRALAEDAAFFGLSKLHTMLTAPRQPSMDLAWAGLSARVVCFEDVLRGNLPENVSYTTSGLCSFDCGAVRPVIIFARNIAIKYVPSSSSLFPSSSELET